MEDLEKACKEIFRLSFPPKEDVLKGTYRRLTRVGEWRHPDLGGDHEKFIRMDLIYRSLVPWTVANLIINSGETEILIRGKKLSEFGQGLGPTTNGVTCDKCQGKGYGRATRRVVDLGGPYIVCPICLGKPYTLWTRFCIKCGTRGRVYTQKIDRTDWWECWDCEGVGEIRIMNPVIQKGSLS